VREDAPILLDLIDEAFNQVSLAVQMRVILTLLAPIDSRRDHRLRCLSFNQSDEVCRVVAGISDQDLERDACDECLGLRDVMALSLRSAETAADCQVRPRQGGL
jgi:hypothetical protein